MKLHMRLGRGGALALMGVCVAALLAGCGGSSEKQRKLGDTYWNMGKYDEAQAAFEKAIEARPDNAAAHVGLARTLAKKNAAPEAIVAYEKALELDPSLAEARSELIALLRDEGRGDEALELARKAGGDGEAEVLKEVGRAGGPAESARAPEGRGVARAPEPETDWRELWRRGEMNALVEGRDSFLAVDDAEARDTIALAALFAGQDSVAKEVAAGAPSDNKVRRLIDTLERLRGGAAEAAGELRGLLDEWTETGEAREVLSENAKAFAYARMGLRAQAFRRLSDITERFPSHGAAPYVLARMYEAARMPDFAAAAWRRLVAVNPMGLDARAALYESLRRAGKAGEARAQAESTFGLFPDERRAVLDLARAYMDGGEPEQAVTALRGALNRAPGEPAARLALASALLSAGAASEAEEALRDIQAPEALRPQAAAHMGFALAQQNKWAEAAGALQAAGSAPLPAGRLLLTSALLRGGASAEDAARSLTTEPEAPQAYLRSAAVLRRALGQDASGLEAEDAALAERVAGKPEILSALAYALACQEFGLFSAAYESFETARQAVGPEPRLLSLMLGALAEARNMADRSARADALAAEAPANASVWLGVARVREAGGNLAGAREAAEEAVRLAGDSAAPWMALASLAEKQHDNAGALRAYERLLSLRPEDPIMKNNLAYYMLQTGGAAERAAQLAAEANEALPLNAGVLHTLGLAQLRANDIEGATKHLSLALELRPGDPTMLLDYGQLLLAMGRREDGRRQIELALRYTEMFKLDFPREDEAKKLLAAR